MYISNHHFSNSPYINLKVIPTARFVLMQLMFSLVYAVMSSSVVSEFNIIYGACMILGKAKVHEYVRRQSLIFSANSGRVMVRGTGTLDDYSHDIRRLAAHMSKRSALLVRKRFEKNLGYDCRAC